MLRHANVVRSDCANCFVQTVGKAIDADSLFFLKQQEQLRQIISHHQQQPSQSSAPHQQPGGRPPSVPSGVNPMLLEAMQKLQLQQQQQLSGYPTNVMQHQAMMEQMAQQSNRGRVPSPISGLQWSTDRCIINDPLMTSYAGIFLKSSINIWQPCNMRHNILR